jgi:tRNA modification GTPase
MLPWDDTIAALASAPGGSDRGLLRVSGPETGLVLERLWEGTPHPTPPFQRGRHALRLRLPGGRGVIPVEVQAWPTSRSYTGQPLAELHLPGSPPLLQAVLARLYACGARPARPGEFTLRAFLAGKVDLLQAEGVLGVIDATDHHELATALGQLAGGLSSKLTQLRGDLLELVADLEAGLDFVEEDIEFVSRADVRRRVEAARQLVMRLATQAHERMHAGERPRVVLAGLPNAGKSTLFNALLGTGRALVSPIAGTTRDYLTAVWRCGGREVELVDTAGWEPSVTAFGPQVSALREDQFQRADLVLWCTAADLPTVERHADLGRRQTLMDQGVPVLSIRTKSDARNGGDSPESVDNDPAVKVSVARGTGLAELTSHVAATLSRPGGRERSWLGASAARCAASLHAALAALTHAEELAASPAGDELIAAELRGALHELGAIVGAVYTDDLLDRIFSKFCIGK